MLRSAISLLAVIGLGVLLGPTRAATTDAPTDEDEQALKARSIGVEGPALLDYFRARTPSESRRQQAAALIRELGDDSFATREEATKKLIRLGTPALPELKTAQKHPDLEVRRRVERCMTSIQSQDPGALAAAAARLVRVRKPAGAVDVLVDFLPFVDNADAEEEIFVTLALLSAHDGKPAPALVEAGRAEDAMKRASAALILNRYGDADQKKTARERLGDADARVRFRAAQGTLADRDKAAIPTLIALLEETSGELGQKAEELLYRAAGEKSPAEGLPGDAAGRKKAREAWTGWWKENEARLDLAKADVELLSVNPGLQARRVADQFLTAYLKGDAAGLRRTLNAPFFMPQTLNQEQKLQTRDEVVRFFQATGKMTPRTGISFSVTGAMPIETYLKTAGDREKVDLLRRPGTMAVSITANDNGRKEDVWLFVRPVGGRAYVVGVGEGRRGK
jgi:hypothetical protein